MRMEQMTRQKAAHFVRSKHPHSQAYKHFIKLKIVSSRGLLWAPTLNVYVILKPNERVPAGKSFLPDKKRSD